MFIVINISHLITDYLCIAYCGVNVGMRMAVNPCINATVSNIVTKFCSKGSV